MNDSEPQLPNPSEFQFFNSDGEVLTEQEYIRWELNDLLRYVHERTAYSRTHYDGRVPSGVVEEPKGILAAMASSPQSGLSVTRIASLMSIRDLNFDKLEQTLNALVDAGLVTKESGDDEYTRIFDKYSLVASDVDYGDLLQQRLDRQDQDRAARRDNFRGTRIGKLVAKLGSKG